MSKSIDKRDEVLKLALEALEDYVEEYGPHEQDSGVAYAITAIREALASEACEQPAQQEPVAWMFQHEETGRTMCVDAQQVEWGFEKGNPRLKKIAPLYTSSQPSKPLTDEEILYLFADYSAQPFSPLLRRFARAIEAAHGIKENT